MRVLVTAASKHGATQEIAQAIGDTLTGAGVEVAVLPVDDVPAGAVGGYGAVVLGSAVYAGHWLAPAKEFVARDAAALAARPVWLFSSGPIGDPPKPTEDPVDAAAVIADTHAREHRVFSGRLERSHLGFAERAIVAALRAPHGDFRPWDEIREWAGAIARDLRSEDAGARVD